MTNCNFRSFTRSLNCGGRKRPSSCAPFARCCKKNDLLEAGRLMRRVIQIQHLMLQNMRMLETMSPWDFHGFRGKLGDGAGTDSPGFHALMMLSPLLWDDFQDVLKREQ